MIIDYNFKMMTLFEFAICLFFVLTMFPSFHMFCLISIDQIVTYFFPRLEHDD
jgi:hypothetical protein